MEVLLTILFFFIVAGYILKRVLPFLLTWWLKNQMNKMPRQEPNGFSKNTEGEVIVSGDIKSSDKVVDREVGDYVEFEEKSEKS